MGKYINSQLINNEKVIYEGQTSLLSQWPLLLLGIITVAIGGLGLIFFALIAIRYFTTELAFTNKRLVAKFGLIARQTVELKLEKIESVQVKQGVIGRILNYGTLIIGGAGNPQAPIPGISTPMAFKRALQEFTDQNIDP